MRRTFRWRMSSTDDHTNDLCGGEKDIIADHTKVNDVMKNDKNDTNDMNKDEYGEKIAIRTAATEVETMAKAACPTQHQMFRCGQRTLEMKASGVSIADQSARSGMRLCSNCIVVKRVIVFHSQRPICCHCCRHNDFSLHLYDSR